MPDTSPFLANTHPGESAHDAVLSRAGEALGEIGRVVDTLDPSAVAALLEAMGQARHVFFDAQGRSGLVARALAMRWMHLGGTSYVTGEAVTPAIGAGDLLICLSASGRTGITLAHARTARSANARVIALTAASDSPLAASADLVVVLPARTRVATAQHAGSLFEQACLIVGDALCGSFQALHVIPDDDLDGRHANLL